MEAMARLNRIWRCNTISFASKFNSTSLLSPPSSALAVKRGPCSMTEDTKGLRKLLRISCLEHKTIDWVRGRINSLAGPQEPLLATVKRRKLAWLWHVTRHNSFSKTIL